MNLGSLGLALVLPLASLGAQTPIVDHHQHFFSPTLLAEFRPIAANAPYWR